MKDIPRFAEFSDVVPACGNCRWLKHSLYGLPKCWQKPRRRLSWYRMGGKPPCRGKDWWDKNKPFRFYDIQSYKEAP